MEATGARNIELKVPGTDKNKVVSALDVLDGKVQLGKQIVVVGGGLIGTETALYLAEHGYDIYIVEMLNEIMADVAVTDKIAYAERIKKTSLKIYTGYKLVEITAENAVLSGSRGDTKLLPADTIITAIGLSPDNSLYNALTETSGSEVYKIGDAISAGKIYDAMHTAYKLALNI